MIEKHPCAVDVIASLPFYCYVAFFRGCSVITGVRCCNLAWPEDNHLVPNP
jgi:hypothetical protein